MAIKRTSVLGNTSRNTRSAEREVSEYDGGWLNIGVNITDSETGDTKFIRLPLGVSVADLAKRKRKIYPKTIEENPAYAAELQIENDMIDQVCAMLLQMEEGESVATDVLDVQLYRRNEEVDTADVAVDAPKFNLFAKA